MASIRSTHCQEFKIYFLGDMLACVSHGSHHVQHCSPSTSRPAVSENVSTDSPMFGICVCWRMHDVGQNSGKRNIVVKHIFTIHIQVCLLVPARPGTVIRASANDHDFWKQQIFVEASGSWTGLLERSAGQVKVGKTKPKWWIKESG